MTGKYLLKIYIFEKYDWAILKTLVEYKEVEIILLGLKVTIYVITSNESDHISNY